MLSSQVLQLHILESDWIKNYYIGWLSIYMQNQGDINLINSFNFDNFEYPSDGRLCTAKQNSSIRVIRKISYFEVSINPIQSWW